MAKRREVPEGAITLLKKGQVRLNNAAKWQKWFGKLFRQFDDLETAQKNKKNNQLIAIVVAGKNCQFEKGYALYDPCILPKQTAKVFRNKKIEPQRLAQ